MNDTEDLPCPYCGQGNAVPVDASAGSQEFITDCEVCCRPFSVRVETENGEIISLETGAG